MYLSISHSFLDRFAWNMDQIQAISHVHTAAWPNNRSQPVITGYWPVIENFQNWKNQTDNFLKRQKLDRWSWSSHKSVQFGPVSGFFPVLPLDFKTLIFTYFWSKYVGIISWFICKNDRGWQWCNRRTFLHILWVYMMVFIRKILGCLIRTYALK